MKNKIAWFVGMALVIVGVILGCFAFPGSEIVGFAVTMFGAGAMCVALWKGRKEGTPTWVAIVSLVLVGAGSFIAGFIGLIGADVFKEVIGYIISAVLIIIGALIPAIAKKIQKK